MKGDRDKAIQAGASDYVTKPVDPEKLLSIMHLWMERKDQKIPIVESQSVATSKDLH